jgi:predicted alpha/beta-fold hydrolase
MTIAPSFVPRGFGLRRRQVERVLIPVAPDSKILAMAHFQADYRQCPTLVLVHGLEGSSQSFYMVGLAEKALAAGANVVRVNLRNCGDTLHLTPTLYNAGLSFWNSRNISAY